MKPKVHRSPGTRFWTWSCDVCPKRHWWLEENQATAFSAAERHAQTVLHRLRADLLDRRLRAGGTK